MPDISRPQILSKKLESKPLDSKKAIYALVGALCVLGVFAISAYLILKHAEASKDIVELANLVVIFFGTIITTLITGQAVMDWKCVSALQRLDVSEISERRETRDQSLAVDSNQPIQNLNLSNNPVQETFVSGGRSPKDFLGRDTSF